MYKKLSQPERQGREALGYKLYNGIYAISRRNASLQVFLALGFDFDDAFELSYPSILLY